MARVYRGYRQSQAVMGRWDLANPGNRAILTARERVTQQVLTEAGFMPLAGRAILEVGCGSGGELGRLQSLGARPSDLHGIDMLAERIDEARRRFPDLDLRVASGENLDAADEHYDVVLAITLFSSILDDTIARRVAREITRVLKPGGAVLWYDFRFDNPRNPNVRGVTPAAIARLFPALEIRLRTVTLLPPLARRLGPATPVLYPVLAAIPILRTHCLGLLLKPRHAPD